nr:cellulose binding domain-containing protein [uncultured Flavobacterium sp.]
MKEKVAAEESPWIEGWNTLVSDWKSSATYGISGGVLENANQRQNMNRDAQAAYLNALRWYVSGDVAHAEKAISIYNAYAYKVNQIPSGGNTDILGLGGIGFTAMAMGAEIMRLYEGWAPADFEKFKFMMKEYFYPVSHDFLTNHKGACPTYYWANWDLNNISALVAIGILVDDRDIFNEGVEYFKNGIGAGSIKNAVPFVQGNFGQWQESGRDQSHALLGIGLMANTCQMAWNQGLDLYGYDDNRFLKGAEYAARTGALSLAAPFFEEYDSCFNRGHRWISINGLGKYHDQPVWEILYNHYVIKQGLEAPHVKAMAQMMRLSVSTFDQLGHGTLTYTLGTAASPVAFTAPPGQLQGFTVQEGIGMVEVRWNAVEAMDAQGFTVKRATSPGGPYTTVGSWTGSTDPKYTDTNVENGKTYYYVVSAKNNAGEGPDSVEISATPRTAVQELPIGWTRTDIGTSSVEGGAVYAKVNTGDSFITKGAGWTDTGSSDSMGFTYGIASGDVTLTARVVTYNNLQKTGIMIRESLDTNAKTVLMKIGDGGWRIAGMGLRNETGTEMWFKDGNRYTWAPDVWFRISRTGNTFTVYESNNKDVWFEVGSATIEMAENVYVGLFNSSGNGDTLQETRFDNVTVTGQTNNVPEAPANFTASSGNTQNMLDWDEVTGASSYILKRSTTSGGPYANVTNLSTTDYTDSGLENGTTYYYVVSAANFSGESVNSLEMNATPELAIALAPEGVTAQSASGQQIDLSWNESLSATSYNVKRATTSGGPYTTIAGPNTTVFSDTDVNDATTYYYVITAVNALGESEDSEEISATPGQISYLKFDETAGTNAADFWGNNAGTLNSGVTFSEGLIDNAVSLDGVNGYVTLPEGIINHLTDFSISSWIKLDKADNWARVFDFGSGTNNYMFLIPKNGQNSRLRYAIKNGGSEQQINTSASLTTGRWYHLAVTQSGSTAILYLDGVEVGRNTNMTLNPSTLGNTTKNYLGKSQWPDPLLAGQVDDFRIYSKALSALEIAEMAFAYLPPATPKNLSTVAGNNQISLTWTPSLGGTGYNVKRGTSIEGPFEVIANVVDTSYVDMTAVNCEKYFYTVSTINSVGESADSSPSGPLFGIKLSGILIGTVGSGGNNPATTKEAAIDGDIRTYFDAPINTAWVGYDLGEDGRSVITKVRYSPRIGLSHRMNGSQIQGANTPNFSDAEVLFFISKPDEWVMTEQTISNTKGFRYIRYYSPNGYGSIAELEFYGLPAQLPEFSSESIVEGTYGSEFQYSTVASTKPEKFSALGLPDGLRMDACMGIISGIPNAAGSFPVDITATNYYGSSTYTVELMIKKNQTIDFSSMPVKYIGDVDFELSAVTSSGLPITYSSSDTTIATIVDGNKLHINGVGTSIITASQIGDSIYYPVEPVDQTFNVLPLDFKILYKNGDNGSTSNGYVKPHLQIENNDAISVAYSELSIRYWFTAENYAGINTWIDYAQLGNNKISLNYVSLPEPHEGALGYIEYRFDESSGNLMPGVDSGSIQSKLSNSDWSNFDETDDYSYQSNPGYVENEQITLYRNGLLVWGTEPGAVTPELNLKVYSENKNDDTNMNKMHTFLKLNNEGNMSIDYKDLSIRYWFTKDSDADLKYWMDYAALGGSNISGQFVELSSSVAGADTYFEITLDSLVGTLYPLSSTGNIQYRITKSNWLKFEELDDYSYLPKAPFAENSHITVYHKGALVYGIEPGADTNYLKKSRESQKILSIDELETAELKVYPNPVLDILTVLLNNNDGKEVQIMLHSVTGKLLITTKTRTNTYMLDFSTMAKGVYILTVTDANGSIFKKILKE